MSSGEARSILIGRAQVNDPQSLVLDDPTTSLDHNATHELSDILRNLTRRGIEFALLPWCRARGIGVMAYSPVEQGRLLQKPSPAILRVAERHHATPAQIALAWALRQDRVSAIPKSATVPHVRENRAAADIHLTEQDLSEIDAEFPPPKEPRPLEMI